jgi:hypothetical protein
MSDRPVLLHWAPWPDWLASRGHMTWLCYCDAEVRVDWRASCDLYDTDEAIQPDDAVADSWQVECHNGHVLLTCQEVAEDEGVDCFDCFDPPTTGQLVQRLASAEDVAAWKTYRAEKATQ